MEQREIKVFGQVQGVGFRFSTQRKAQKLGLTGWVRNEPDQSVRIVVQGEKPSIKEFIKWCPYGPLIAQPRKVEVKKQEIKEKFNNFHIKY